MSEEVRWSNLRTADPLCACAIEAAFDEDSPQPPFMIEAVKTGMRRAYAKLYDENGGCVEHPETEGTWSTK